VTSLGRTEPNSCPVFLECYRSLPPSGEAKKNIDHYMHSPMHLHGVVLSELGTGTLPLTLLLNEPTVFKITQYSVFPGRRSRDVDARWVLICTPCWYERQGWEPFVDLRIPRVLPPPHPPLLTINNWEFICVWVGGQYFTTNKTNNIGVAFSKLSLCKTIGRAIVRWHELEHLVGRGLRKTV
jgi:hypothetical protein